MVKLIAGRDVSRHAPLMDEVYRFRHRFFVDGLRWEGLRRDDGREIDAFDTEHCLHVVGLHEGVVSAYTRLLPTTRPHLLSHVYPELLGGAEAPTGPAVWEWTRMSVDPARREGRKGTDRSTAEIYLGVTEACLLHGIEALLIQTHPIYLTRILEVGWRARPLALPQVYDGHPIVPLYAEVGPDTLLRSREVFGMDGSVLEPGTAPETENEIRAEEGGHV